MPSVAASLLGPVRMRRPVASPSGVVERSAVVRTAGDRKRLAVVDDLARSSTTASRFRSPAVRTTADRSTTPEGLATGRRMRTGPKRLAATLGIDRPDRLLRSNHDHKLDRRLAQEHLPTRAERARSFSTCRQMLLCKTTVELVIVVGSEQTVRPVYAQCCSQSFGARSHATAGG